VAVARVYHCRQCREPKSLLAENKKLREQLDTLLHALETYHECEAKTT
jgi:hypothetical protein